MRFLTCLVFLAFLCPAVFGDEGHQHQLTDQEIGSVHFMTSCAKSVEQNLTHGLALLPSFQYEQAGGVFEAVERQDPHCARPCGESLCLIITDSGTMATRPREESPSKRRKRLPQRTLE